MEGRKVAISVKSELGAQSIVSTQRKEVNNYYKGNRSEMPTCAGASKASHHHHQQDNHPTLLLVLLAYGNFWVAACFDLQTPLFQNEANLKGATQRQYQLVLGVYDLVFVISCLAFGKWIARTRPVFVCQIGLLISGSMRILFGVVDKVPDGTPFIVLCLVLRIVEGISSAAFLTCSYAMMTKHFADTIGAKFSTITTFFSLGLIFGPILGQIYFRMGGFVTSFVILGSFLLLGGIFGYVLLSNSYEPTPKKSGDFLKFMCNAGVILDALAVASSLYFVGFNAATLELHLRQFRLNPYIIGFIFVSFTLIFGIVSTIWGTLCDKQFDPRRLCAIGSVLCIIGFVFIGPQDFVDIKTHLWLTIASLVIIGFGLASKMVTPFISSLNDSLRRRHFEDDISTYGLVASLYLSANSIGYWLRSTRLTISFCLTLIFDINRAFVGPILAKFLMQSMSYRQSTLHILIIEILLVLFNSLYIVLRKSQDSTENKPVYKRQQDYCK